MVDPLVGIEVHGLAQLRRDLRRMGVQYRKALDKELRAAARPIVVAAKRSYREEHPPHRGRGSRRSKGSQRGIRASSGGGNVRVTLDGTRYPWLQGQEWGSGSYPQFPAATQNRPPLKRGYFFWPAVVEGREDVSDRVRDAVDRINRSTFKD